MFYVFSCDYDWTCMGSPIRMVGSVCSIVWDIYIVIFRKMGFGQQEDIYFLDVEKYFYFFYALGQPVCIPRRCVVYVNYFTNLLSTVVRRFMSVLISSACLDKIVSNLVKDSCIILISVFLCVVCCDCWRFDTISGCLGICHFLSSFSFLWCCRAFVLLSRCICDMITSCCLRWRKTCVYDFLVDFAASIASRMRLPTM
jgi:hypothetical protein